VAQEELANARQAELAARQSLTRELLATQERERTRLAGELHDGVGQQLSLLRNRAVMLKRAQLPAEAREHADALIDMASESIEELRGIAHNLRPLLLEELGLCSALEALVERVQLSSELAVHARIDDVDDLLRGEAAVHTYRIVQEAINNVLRHAGAANLWLEVRREAAGVELQVRDDGCGMAAASTSPQGIGLSSIRERCAILGAALDLQSHSPSGTTLRVRITLSPTAAR
jgi:signal transduction histidine kinase